MDHFAVSGNRDPQTLAALIAHQEFGQHMGCWK
jgi:hypothetical protein